MSQQTRRDFLKTLGAGAVGMLWGCSSVKSAPVKKQPNFVFILVDDLGWTDLGCFGSSFYDTPNIDKLCASGMKFTNAYAACPVCSPTRASILTGKYPQRVGITDFINSAGGNQPRISPSRSISTASRKSAAFWAFPGDLTSNPAANPWIATRSGLIPARPGCV